MAVIAFPDSSNNCTTNLILLLITKIIKHITTVAMVASIAKTKYVSVFSESTSGMRQDGVFSLLFLEFFHITLKKQKKGYHKAPYCGPYSLFTHHKSAVPTMLAVTEPSKMIQTTKPTRYLNSTSNMAENAEKIKFIIFIAFYICFSVKSVNNDLMGRKNRLPSSQGKHRQYYRVMYSFI